MAWTAGDRFNRAALWITVALGFSIPVSTALDGVLLAALLVCWLAGGRYREKWIAVQDNGFALAIGAFFLLHVAGSAYTIGSTRAALDEIGKAAYMLLAPLLISLQPDAEWRRRALLALLAAVGLTLVLSFPIWLGVMPDLAFIKGQPVDAVVFKKKIGHSVLMAFGAFVLLLSARDRTGTKARVLLCLLAGLAAFNVTFMVWGRTGQVVLMALLAYFVIRSFGWRGVSAAAALALIAGATVYFTPTSALHVRTAMTLDEIRSWQAHGRPNDDNMRLQTWTNSLELLKQRPLIGTGTGGFVAAYSKLIEGTSMAPADQPENQYLLTAVQLGAVGLAALLALFGFQWHLAAHLESRVDTDLARGLVILMVVGCMFNSFLRDHSQALFYAWLSGLLYARPRTGAARA
jgi:O-antigen ligase